MCRDEGRPACAQFGQPPAGRTKGAIEKTGTLPARKAGRNPIAAIQAAPLGRARRQARGFQGEGLKRLGTATDGRNCSVCHGVKNPETAATGRNSAPATLFRGPLAKPFAAAGGSAFPRRLSARGAPMRPACRSGKPGASVEVYAAVLGCKPNRYSTAREAWLAAVKIAFLSPFRIASQFAMYCA